MSIDLETGLQFIRGSQNLKNDFIASGYEGKISFIKACICSGAIRDHEIVAMAMAIAGDYIENEFRLMIEAGEGQHWCRIQSGELALFSGHDDC